MTFDYVDTCSILIICYMFLIVLKVTYCGMHDTQGRAVFNLVNDFTRIYDTKRSFNVIFPKVSNIAVNVFVRIRLLFFSVCLFLSHPLYYLPPF